MRDHLERMERMFQDVQAQKEQVGRAPDTPPAAVRAGLQAAWPRPRPARPHPCVPTTACAGPGARVAADARPPDPRTPRHRPRRLALPSAACQPAGIPICAPAPTAAQRPGGRWRGRQGWGIGCWPGRRRRPAVGRAISPAAEPHCRRLGGSGSSQAPATEPPLLPASHAGGGASSHAAMFCGRSSRLSVAIWPPGRLRQRSRCHIAKQDSTAAGRGQPAASCCGEHITAACWPAAAACCRCSASHAWQRQLHGLCPGPAAEAVQPPSGGAAAAAGQRQRACGGSPAGCGRWRQHRWQQQAGGERASHAGLCTSSLTRTAAD